MIIARQIGDSDRGEQRDFRAFPHRAQQAGAEPTILHHRAERVVLLTSIEMQILRVGGVGHANLADRAAVGIEDIAQPQGAQHARRRAGHGGGAAIEGRKGGAVQILRVDHDARHIMPGQGQRQCGANQAATDDDHVCIHRHTGFLADLRDSPKRDMMSGPQSVFPRVCLTGVMA